MKASASLQGCLMTVSCCRPGPGKHHTSCGQHYVACSETTSGGWGDSMESCTVSDLYVCSIVFIKHGASSRMECVNSVTNADLSTRPIPFWAWSTILGAGALLWDEFLQDDIRTLVQRRCTSHPVCSLVNRITMIIFEIINLSATKQRRRLLDS